MNDELKTVFGDFIREHRNDDVRKLALQIAGRKDIDVPFVLDQIAGWQKACEKLPSWAATDGIVYPPHLSMEQCSGEPAALYKAAVARRICGCGPDGRAGMIADLTGGFGVDFSFMSRCFERSIYVERNERLSMTARHNFGVLALGGAEAVCADCTEYLHGIDHATLIYMDPARRDARGGRTYAISDCTPDVLGMLPELVDKADHVMLKLSPMLDWHEAVASLNAVCPDVVREIHVVSVRNECKELLFVLSCHSSAPVEIYCSNGGDTLRCTMTEAMEPAVLADMPYTSLVGKYLYEPDASVMKAGCFGLLCRRYDVRQVGANSRLFISDSEVAGFPGRHFIVNAVSSMNKKELKAVLAGVEKANVAVRNFPLTVAELRKRLRLGDGGDVYVFGTTCACGTRAVAVCSKV